MDSFNVVITNHALAQLERYIDYIQYVLLDEQTADSVSLDTFATQERLQNLASDVKMIFLNLLAITQ